MKSTKNVLAMSALAAVMGVTMSINASAAIIDLFDDSPGVSVTDTNATVTGLADGGASGSQTENNPGSILGGHRDLFVEVLDSDITKVEFNDTAKASLSVVGNSLNFSADTKVSAMGEVQWDGGDGSTVLDHTGLGGNSDLATATHFVFNVDFADAGFEFVLTAYEDSTNYTSILFKSAGNTTGFTLTRMIDLSLFDTLGSCGSPPGGQEPDVLSISCFGTGTNWSNLGALVLTIDPLGKATSIDFSVGALEAKVPEPASLALFGMGLLACGFVSRRKKVA